MKPDKIPVASEAEVQKACLKLLAMKGVLAWRSNSRVFTVAGKGGRPRPMRAGLGKGSADVLMILPGGRFGACEVKRPGERPTPEQVAWLRQVNAAGGLAVWVDSVELLATVLEFVGKGGGRAVVSFKDDGDWVLDRED